MSCLSRVPRRKRRTFVSEIKPVKMKDIQRIIILTAFLLVGSWGWAGSATEVASLPSDSLVTVSEAGDTLRPKKQNFISRFLEYFNDANKNKHHKKFDFSVIGGPHYSSSVGLGLGIMASGLYYPANDTLVPPSNVTVFGDIATSGFCLIGVAGNNLLKGDRYRLNYKMYLYSFPTSFYGMGYEDGLDEHHKSSYNRFQSRMQVAFLFRIAKALFAGPQLSWDYVHGTKAERPEYWRGQDMTIGSFSSGLNLTYDSRDNLTAPYKGIYVNLFQRFFPKGLGNGTYHFNSTELTANFYTPVWKGGVLAAQVHGLFNYGGTVPWFQMAMVGGNSSMRGYYEGRYRDKNMVDGQIELRQHIWKRNGIAVWMGAANIFPEPSAMRLNKTLPNFGIGYRWEFKKRVNVRLDYGIGKHISGFLFNINEAF